MADSDADKVFAGSIPKLYETYLVPLIFEPYAADLANRLIPRSLSRVLEIAAGTGVVTRVMARLLTEKVAIVATDLNQAMLDQASLAGTKRPVEWRQADAMRLPFPDGTFDAVVCQFGVMFFPKSPTRSQPRSNPFFPTIHRASWPARRMAITTVAASSAILRTGDSLRRRASIRSRRAAGRPPAAFRRSPTARERR
jgi:SAM-dependent methyltransferase